MSGSEVCTATPLWQIVLASENPNQAFAAVVVLAVITVWFVNTVWTSWNLSYNLQLLWEYATIRIPDIQLDDLPESVTRDDGVESKAPAAGTVRTLQDPKKPGLIQCYDPATQQWLGEVKAMNASDVHELCSKAAAAQKEWQKTSFTERRKVLRTMQKYICAHVTEICRVSARDSGKPAVDACLGEVLTTTEKIRTLCASGELWLRPDYRAVGPMFLHKTARVEYVPLGVIAPIAPWNYPYV
jgi:delta 1-pyrroline-5-carboxylate dehydrogenase